MVTKILLIIMLVLYIALLIMRYKKKDNRKSRGRAGCAGDTVVSHCG